MYYQGLELFNIACFDDVRLAFNNRNNERAKWIFLVGENATGKTNILNCAD
jgi:recombinational DNA repair ATPase RecF